MPRMAPAASAAGAPRQLWVWSLPSLVLLLSLVWYKRKRNTLRSDPGGTSGTLLPAEAGHRDVEEEDGGEEEVTTAEVRKDSREPDSSTTVPAVDAFILPADSVESVREEPLAEAPSAPVTPQPPTAPAVVGPVEEASKPVEQKPAEAVEEVVVAVERKPVEQKLVEAVEEEVVVVEKLVEAVEEVVVVERKQEQVASVAVEQQQQVAEVAMKDTKEEVSVDVDEARDKVSALEGKLASLALSGPSSKTEQQQQQQQQRGADRDSANHSPVDAMLASPSISSYSDEHSEGSSDSGKGCSDVASPPSRTPVGGGSLAGDAEGDAEGDADAESGSAYSVYEFLLPQLLVGRLIGRHGAFAHEIKAKTNATIWIKKHPEISKQKICSIEGTSPDIDNALAMIRHRFPLTKYPNMTLEQISVAPVPATFPLVPDFCQLHLVEGVNNEVMISSLVSPAHMFLQQPYHPSYQFLQRLNHMMNSIYASVETPNLPDPIEGGNICVAPAVDGWYRAQVVSSSEDAQASEIKFVDYGGYMSVNNSVLRQIRQDFMTLPFQATECYLANIKPSGESGEWSLDALRIVEELTRGQMLLAQVYDYAADGVPLIYLYSSVNSQPWMYDPEVVLINQELVARGMADLDDTVISAQTSEAASLVVAAKAVAAASVAPTEDSTASSTAKSEEKPPSVEPSLLSGVMAN